MRFSTAPLSQFFVLGTSGDKNSVDKHHIFSKHYLEQIGYDNDRNQIANFTYLDYATNIDISDAPPVDYVGRYRTKLGEEGYKLACAQNALPENFESLEYPEFLAQRRMLMSQIVRKAFEELSKQHLLVLHRFLFIPIPVKTIPQNIQNRRTARWTSMEILLFTRPKMV